MLSQVIDIVILVVFMSQYSLQDCKNSSDSKYDLIEPAQITSYFSTCSEYTKRTCCSIKNLDLLIKRIKKSTQSMNISPDCKNIISKMYCSTCDGDWGQGYYSGVCNNECLNLYQNCKNDLFILDSNNNKLRPCKQDDLFCWKLKDIASHFKLSPNNNKARVQICSYFDILGSENNDDCWRGQISSEYRGRGKIKLNYAAAKKPKRIKKWWEAYTKEIFYSLTIFSLAAIFLYKFCKPSRPRYYRLN